MEEIEEEEGVLGWVLGFAVVVAVVIVEIGMVPNTNGAG